MMNTFQHGVTLEGQLSFHWKENKSNFIYAMTNCGYLLLLFSR